MYLKWEGKILTGSNLNKALFISLYMTFLVSTKDLINCKMKIFIHENQDLKL